MTPYERGHSGKTKQKALFYETFRRKVDSQKTPSLEYKHVIKKR